MTQSLFSRRDPRPKIREHLPLFDAVCTHRTIHLEHGRAMIPVGEPRDLGGCVNQDLACPDCGAIVGESSASKVLPAAPLSHREDA